MSQESNIGESTSPDEKAPAGRREAAPELYAISRGRAGWSLSRRNMLAAAAAAASVRNAGAGNCAAAAHAGGAGPLLISADGRMLIAGNKCWSLPDGALLHKLEAGPSAVTQDWRLMVCIGLDSVLRVWSLPEVTLVKTVSDIGGLKGAAISPNGKLLAVACYDRSVKLWSLPDVTQKPALYGHSAGLLSVAFSPDGRLLATCGSDSVWLWSTETSTLLKTLRAPSDAGAYSPRVEFSPDGRLLALASLSNTVPYRNYVHFWSVPDGAPVSTIMAPEELNRSFYISPDWRMVAWPGARTVKLYSVPGGSLLANLTGHTDSVTCVNFSPNGRFLASGDSKGTILLWSLPDGRMLQTLTGHAGGVSYLARTPDERVLVSFDLTDILLWSLPDGERMPVCFMDPVASFSSASAITYTLDRVTYTVPAGTPLPTGAVCTCNTVKGTATGGGCGIIYWYPN